VGGRANHLRVATQLLRKLGAVKISERQCVGSYLKTRSGTNLWDVVSPTAVLYRLSMVERRVGVGARLICTFLPISSVLACLISWLRPLVVAKMNRPGVRLASRSRSNVLVLGFTRHHYETVLRPVVEHLISQNYDVNVVSDSPNLQTPGIPRQLFYIGAVAVAAKLFFLICRAFSYVAADCIRRSTTSSPGLFQQLYWIFWRDLPRIIRYVVVAERIFGAMPPKLVIAADDVDYKTRSFILVAKQANIPTLLIQQGLASVHYPEWLYLACSKVACMGDGAKAVLVDQGVSPEAITVTGPPGFDVLYGYTHRPRSGARKTVVFASQPFYEGAFASEEIYRRMTSDIVFALSHLDAKIVVKPHPSQAPGMLRGLCAAYPRLILAQPTDDIRTLIRDCDVFLSISSTSMLEALYCGRVVISVDYPGSGIDPIYTESGATLVARSAEDLRRLLDISLQPFLVERLLDRKKEARRKLLHDFVHIPDGRATERVVGVIGNEINA